MSEKDAVKELTSQLKWYVPHRSQSWASQFLTRYESGAVKQKTVDKLLNDFGYEIEKEREWKKVQR